MSDLEDLKKLKDSTLDSFKAAADRILETYGPEVEELLRDQAEKTARVIPDLARARLQGDESRLKVKEEVLLSIAGETEIRLRSIAGDVAEATRHAFRDSLRDILTGVSKFAGLKIPI